MVKFPRPLPAEILEVVKQQKEPAVFAMVAGEEDDPMPGLIVTAYKEEAVHLAFSKHINVSSALHASFTAYGSVIALQAKFDDLADDDKPPVVVTALLDSDQMDNDPVINALQTANKIAIIIADVDGTCYAMRVGEWDKQARNDCATVIQNAKLYDGTCRRKDRYHLDTAQDIYLDRQIHERYN